MQSHTSLHATVRWATPPASRGAGEPRQDPPAKSSRATAPDAGKGALSPRTREPRGQLGGASLATATWKRKPLALQLDAPPSGPAQTRASVCRASLALNAPRAPADASRDLAASRPPRRRAEGPRLRAALLDSRKEHERERETDRQRETIELHVFDLNAQKRKRRITEHSF